MVFASTDLGRPFDSCWFHPDTLTFCGLKTSPFSAFMSVFDVVVPGFGMLFIWGPIVLGLWYGTKSPMIAGIFGMIISVTVTGLHPQSVGVGILLFALASALATIEIFQRIKQSA